MTNIDTALVERARKAIADEPDHLDPASCNEVDLTWLAAQLACWPIRVDPDCTTNMRFLMTSAAAIILHHLPALQSTREKKLEAALRAIIATKPPIQEQPYATPDGLYSLPYDSRPVTIAEATLSDGEREALPVQGGEWRDIASAPRNGTEMLAYSEQGCTGVMLVRYTSLSDFLTDAEGDEYFRQGGSEEGFREEDWFVADFIQGTRLSPDCHPSHWMPLPPPSGSAPVTSTQGGEEERARIVAWLRLVAHGAREAGQIKESAILYQVASMLESSAHLPPPAQQPAVVDGEKG